MTRRVLLASLNAGGGHHALRDSFAASLARVDPGRQELEPVVWTSADRFIDRFYSMCVRFLPRFQGKIVELSGQPWALRTAMALSPQLHTEALALLRRERFDLLLTTHPMQAITFAEVRREFGLDTPLVLAVPDYGVPASGYLPPITRFRSDALIVMEGRDTARSGLKTEVAAAHPDFASFDLSRPTVLFLGGSAWTVKTEPVLQAVLDDRELRGMVNVVVVAGRDRAFETRLRDRAGNGLHVFGFVAPEVLAALMGLADVPVLGSLAPATLQELLEVGLGPLLLFHFIPGSERAHVGYIETQRLGVYAPETAEMLRLVREVLSLLPASEQLARARDGFRERARLLRSRSVERALQLPRFLEQMLEAPPISRGGARAVG
jgi:hypothetical protein